MSGKKMTITIEVEGGNPQATIRCGDDLYVVDGLALFADSEADGNLMTFYWNRPGMAANAVVRGSAEAIDRGDEWATQFYRDMLRGFCLAARVRPERKEIDPEDVLKRWESEDPNIRFH
jgi:hypothetical protein